jgi:hypothetical protein
LLVGAAVLNGGHAGEVVAQWGAGHFYMPHMITVDKHGDVWTTDVGTHVATKWSPAGKKLLELGARLEPGHDQKHFCKPTQVLTARGLPALPPPPSSPEAGRFYQEHCILKGQ